MADTIKLVTVYKVATANIRDVLFEGEVGNFNGTSTDLKIPLSNSYKNYDMLGFYLRINGSGVGSSRYLYREIPIELIDEVRTIVRSSDDAVSFCWGYSTSNDYINITKKSTDNELDIKVGNLLCTKVVGIKYVTVGTLIDNKG